jgi:hypothetical protein
VGRPLVRSFVAPGADRLGRLELDELLETSAIASRRKDQSVTLNRATWVLERWLLSPVGIGLVGIRRKNLSEVLALRVDDVQPGRGMRGDVAGGGQPEHDPFTVR